MRIHPSHARPRSAALLAALLMLLSTSACSLFSSTPPTSIVLITIDTIRADHLGTYGYFRDVSPSLDRFASDAILFEKATTPMSFTLPAHLSLMTSSYTTTHTIKTNYAPFGPPEDRPRGLLTLAELLSGVGYRTAAIVSSAPLKDHSGIEQGFDDFSQPVGESRRADETTNEAIRWLEEAGSEPFFLWIHYFDPHAPYDPPGDFRTMFRTGAEHLDWLTTRNIDPTDERHLIWNNRYDGEILYMDGHLQRLFDALAELGLWDEAALVITGDHGEGLGQHNWRQHRKVHNELLFVPLIFRFPSRLSLPPERRTELANLIDIVPTLVDQLEIPISARSRNQFEGVDLFSDEVDRRPYVFAERALARSYMLAGERVSMDGEKYAVLNNDWKYVYFTAGDDELFDMKADPHETANVISQYPELAQALKEEIEYIISTQESARIGEIPEDRMRELRALGYIR